MQLTVFDLIGSVGVGIIIVTYVLLQIESLRSDGLWYSLLNCLGSGMIVVSLVYSFNLAAFVVEVLWTLISLFGVGRFLWKRSR